jgi:hypothetical protein
MTHADLVVGSNVQAEFDSVWFSGRIVSRMIKNGKWTSTALFDDGDKQEYDDETDTNQELRPVRDRNDCKTIFWNFVHFFVRTLSFGACPVFSALLQGWPSLQKDTDIF